MSESDDNKPEPKPDEGSAKEPGKKEPERTRAVVDSRQPGSTDETQIMPRVPDEFETRVDEPESNPWPTPPDMAPITGEELADDEDDEDDDETVIAMRRLPRPDGIETRQMPGVKEEWRERAAQAAEALGETAEIVGEWDSEEGDASLALSVAAASGEVPAVDAEKPAAVAGSIIARAREAQSEWAAKPLEKRLPYFDAMRNELVLHRADYVPSMATAIGRPMVEALAGEFIPVLEALITLPEIFGPLLTDWHAAPARLTAEGQQAVARMAPWGVVVVMNPPGAPFALPMTMAIDALAAGNAVVILAPEEQPRVNEMMRKVVQRSRIPEHLLQVVSGGVDALLAVVDAGPDKLIYFGDADYAPRLAAHCAATGTVFQPVAPAKNTMLVLENATLDRAVHAAMWGAFAGGGLMHCSIERVVVADPVFDEFRMRLIEAVRAMNSHHAQLASLSEHFDPRRFKLLIDDAVSNGARVTWPAGENPGRWIHWKAAVVEALPDRALLATQRFEGPGVALFRADDPLAEGRRLLARAPAGSVSVIGNPTREQRTELELLPVAQVVYQDAFPAGAFGPGWPLGPEMPRTRCSPMAMLRPRVISDGDATAGRIAWFPYTDDKAYALLDAIEAAYGTQTGKRLKAAFKLALNAQRRRLLKGDNS